ncbi:MAG: acetolactate synthase [Planctomycetaceae bacterium]|nr:acetolactate synthase [Planctomycetaceae bacterium]
MRGRDWPCLRQFCVFLENRVGRLHDLMRTIESAELKVMALSVVDTIDFSVVRLIVNEPERSNEVLDLGGFRFIESDILGVELPDDPQPFVMVFSAFLRAELNIHYTYPLLFRRGGRGAIAVHVDDVDQATHLLQDLGYTLLTEGDLLDGDEFY